MIKKTENEFEESKKDISEKWLERIDQSLKTLEHYERIIRNGYPDIYDFIEASGFKNPHVRTALAQAGAIKFMINEFEINFNNCPKVIKKDVLKDLRTRLEIIKKINNGEAGAVYTLQYSTRGFGVIHRWVSQVNFTANFYTLLKLLTELRRDLVSALSHILWVGKELNQDKNVED